MTRRTLRTLFASASALALVVTASACSYDDDSAPVHLGDPGKCVPVDIAAAPETASLLDRAASHFNGSAAAHLAGGSCAFVRVQNIDAPVALRELVDRWPHPDRLGPPPTVWVPGSTMWGELLNARLARRHRQPMAPNGTPFARTPLVVAMPAPMARALDYPRRRIGWADIERLARDPRGWTAYGHAEWGRFRLGKGNPNWSTTALDQTVALDASPHATGSEQDLEQSVVYYGASTHAYFDNWRRLATKNRAAALTYLSAAITDERSVIAYNTGHEQDDISLAAHRTRPALPVVAVYPAGASIESDNPIIVLDTPWSTAAARAGARAFTTFVLEDATQAEVAAAGFRPARGAARPDLVRAANGAELQYRTTPIAPASPVDIEAALTHWQAHRRRAHLLVLVDVSDSMGDAADPQKPDGPAKLDLARPALAAALDQLAPDDDIGLRIFTTKLANPVSPNWLDVVPGGPLATRRAALDTAIAGLTREQGSPLYAATHDAYDAVARRADSQRINGVIVLTDGHNEDDHDQNLRALLAHLGANPDVHVFTIAYSNDADLPALQKIAESTNAWNFDARKTTDITDVLPRAFAGF